MPVWLIWIVGVIVIYTASAIEYYGLCGFTLKESLTLLPRFIIRFITDVVCLPYNIFRIVKLYLHS